MPPAEAMEKIGLLFLPVPPSPELHGLLAPPDDRVVACGHVRKPQLIRMLEELIKLDALVAEHAGIRGEALQVEVRKGFHDVAREEVMQVHDLEGDAQVLGDSSNWGYSVTLLPEGTRQKEMEPPHLPPFLFQEGCRDRTVYPAAEGNHHSGSFMHVHSMRWIRAIGISGFRGGPG